MSDTTTVVVRPTGDVTVVVLEADGTIVIPDNGVTVVVWDDATTVVSSGEAGPQGPAGIYIGPLPPANTSILWVDTS